MEDSQWSGDWRRWRAVLITHHFFILLLLLSWWCDWTFRWVLKTMKSEKNETTTPSKWYLTKRTVNLQLFCAPAMGCRYLSSSTTSNPSSAGAPRQKHRMSFLLFDDGLSFSRFVLLSFGFVFDVSASRTLYLQHVKDSESLGLRFGVRGSGFGLVATDTCVIMWSDLSFGVERDLGNGLRLLHVVSVSWCPK